MCYFSWIVPTGAQMEAEVRGIPVAEVGTAREQRERRKEWLSTYTKTMMLLAEGRVVSKVLRDEGVPVETSVVIEDMAALEKRVAEAVRVPESLSEKVLPHAMAGVDMVAQASISGYVAGQSFSFGEEDVEYQAPEEFDDPEAAHLSQYDDWDAEDLENLPSDLRAKIRAYWERKKQWEKQREDEAAREALARMKEAQEAEIAEVERKAAAAAAAGRETQAQRMERRRKEADAKKAEAERTQREQRIAAQEYQRKQEEGRAARMKKNYCAGFTKNGRTLFLHMEGEHPSGFYKVDIFGRDGNLTPNATPAEMVSPGIIYLAQKRTLPARLLLPSPFQLMQAMDLV
jgi:hypothetical protein